MAQRLKQQRMTVRIVQTIETDAQIGNKSRQIRPRRRRFELNRENQISVIAKNLVTRIAEQAPGDGLQRNEILIIGRVGQKNLAVGEGAARVAYAELCRRE